MAEQMLTKEELEASKGATGRIVRIVGPVVDVEFPPDQLPAIYNALTVDAKTWRATCTSCSRSRRTCRATCPLGGHELDGRSRPRPRGRRHGQPDHDARGSRDPGPHLERHGRARRREADARGEGLHAHPPSGSGLRRAVHHHRDLRDRHQGHRPRRALRQGRQDGSVRRRGVGKTVIIQELINNLAQEHGARRCSRAWASVPRGYRPLPGDERLGRHQQDLPRVRSDERASGSASARGSRGPHRGGVLPRSGQDVLLFVDNIFRFTQAGSEVSALLGRMPSAVGYQPTLQPRWATCRSASRRRPPAPSRPCRPCTCPPTT